MEDLRDAAHSRESRYDTSLRDEVFVTISADLGTRPRETIRLTRHMFDLDSGKSRFRQGFKRVSCGKQVSRAATLRLDPYGHFNTTRLLRMYFSELERSWRDYLFPSRQGGHINTNSARNITERLAIEGDVCPKEPMESRQSSKKLIHMLSGTPWRTTCWQTQTPD
ncbi:hypothetical protein D8S78_03380 [Natrialba swarupiae]|nr:hypothetical protein [Natrialba swarupiae]